MADYCTLWPEGNWAKCCKRHDRRYANKRIGKIAADMLLYRCVKRKRGRYIASIMFIGVSLGGWYFYCFKG